MFEKIHPGIWMALTPDIKAKLVSVFDIIRTGGSHVVDNEVVSDGYTIGDLSVITLEKMTEYIGSEESFPRAWELTCMKAKYELNPPVSIGNLPVEATMPEPVVAIGQSLVKDLEKALETPVKTTHAKTEKNK